MTKVNKFKAMQAKAEILDELYVRVQERYKSAFQEYRNTGKQEQAVDWKTSELLWEDEEKTIPKMKDVYDFVDVPEDELSEDQLAKIWACETLLEALEKML
jgi:hypothetical protein